MFCGVSGGQMPLPFAMGIHHTLVPKPDNMVPRGVCAKQLRALEESHMIGYEFAWHAPRRVPGARGRGPKHRGGEGGANHKITHHGGPRFKGGLAYPIPNRAFGFGAM